MLAYMAKVLKHGFIKKAKKLVLPVSVSVLYFWNHKFQMNSPLAQVNLSLNELTSSVPISEAGKLFEILLVWLKTRL